MAKIKCELIMPFPEKKRVKFTVNPLIEVISQLSFLTPYTADDGFNADNMASLHGSVKELFPLFDINKSVTVEYQAEAQTSTTHEEELFEFSNIDKSCKIILRRESVSIATPLYESWEEFKGNLDYFITNGLCQHLPKKALSRVGLRYRDVINRSALGLDGVPWSQLLNKSIAPLFYDDDIRNSLVGGNTTANIRLEDHPGMLLANYGLVTYNPTGEECYLIDSDFYIQGEFDYGAADEHLGVFNTKSRNFFQWAILERLYQALGPTEV